MTGPYSLRIDKIKIINFSFDQLCDTNYPVSPMYCLHDAGL